MYRVTTLLFLLCSFMASAQTNRYQFADTLLSVRIDSAMDVTAKRGLNVNDFIDVMRSDTMFYQAFKNLNRFSFIAENHIATFDENKKNATIYRKIRHNNHERKYKQELLAEKDSGKVYNRKGNYNLYTVEMFSYIFMNDKNTDFINQSVTRKKSDEEGYKKKLKTLIFNPGNPVQGIPLIGSKTEIFKTNMRRFYNYTFYHATYQDSIPIYYFKCKLKPNLTSWELEEVVIHELTTIFDARNFNILGRFIDMNYESIPLDFHVKMNIELAYKNSLLVPVVINYKGDWNIPFKKAENCTFDIKHYNFN